ncbi:MAG: hypothetical protein ABI551_05035 [Polyangiaceae bacterium]
MSASRRRASTWVLVALAVSAAAFIGLTAWTQALPKLHGSAFSVKDMLVRLGAILTGVFAVLFLLTATLPWLLDRLEGRTFVSFVAVRHVRS